MEEKEKIIEIEIERLRDFKEHPLQVKDDEEMRRLKDSISEYDILNPLIVRPRPEGVYEIISGHRRRHAAALAGLSTIPAIVRDMTDDEAVIAMVDANVHVKIQNQHLQVLYYGVDLALEILPPSLNVTRGRKNTGAA